MDEDTYMHPRKNEKDAHFNDKKWSQIKNIYIFIFTAKLMIRRKRKFSEDEDVKKK